MSGEEPQQPEKVDPLANRAAELLEKNPPNKNHTKEQNAKRIMGIAKEYTDSLSPKELASEKKMLREVKMAEQEADAERKVQKGLGVAADANKTLAELAKLRAEVDKMEAADKGKPEDKEIKSLRTDLEKQEAEA